MSYDIYCYRSATGIPEDDDPNAVIEADTDKWAKKEKNAARKLGIVRALINFDSNLEAIDFKFGDIAKLSIDTIEKEKDRFARIEINTKDNVELALSVYDNHVHISIPYFTQLESAVRIFRSFQLYIKIIRDVAGYFVFDPQTGEIFDPLKSEFEGLRKYLSIVKM